MYNLGRNLTKKIVYHTFHFPSLNGQDSWILDLKNYRWSWRFILEAYNHFSEKKKSGIIFK